MYGSKQTIHPPHTNTQILSNKMANLSKIGGLYNVNILIVILCYSFINYCHLGIWAKKTSNLSVSFTTSWESSISKNLN